MFVPPRAAIRPHGVASPHGERTDPYYWLRDDSRQRREVLDHLETENAYKDAVLGNCRPLIDSLYAEMVARIPAEDASVPVRYRGYLYVTRYAAGQEHPVYVRTREPADAVRHAHEEQPVEEVLLDVNALAAGHSFYRIGGMEVSPDNKLLAYTEDTVGRHQYRLRIKSLETGELLADSIDNIEPDVVWANDSRTLLYVEKDPVTFLGVAVRKHILGEDPGIDVLVYSEADETFDLSVSKSKSEQYLYIAADSTLCSEWRYADAADPALRFKLFAVREDGHEYQIDHVDQRFVIRTNWNAANFRIMEVAIGRESQRSAWRDLIAHDADVFIHGFEVFNDFVAVSEHTGGLRNIRIQPWSQPGWCIAADEPAYTLHLGINAEIATTKVQYLYTSLTTPLTTYEYDVRTRERRTLKREVVLGEFDPANYESQFLWVPARDGERIPVSLVRRKGLPVGPLYLYAYGSYGVATDPVFSDSRLSILDRGFTFAIAHVRGGQELGRRWYDGGRLLNKRNSFADFIDVTDALVEQGYAARDQVFAGGDSAGGLLVGCVLNMAPEKYRGAVAQVPFVDIVTTMLDSSIPLTTLEYDEWGDPRRSTFYRYMLSYSPYDNIQPQAYPPILVTAGLWDSQVQYFEPAKWVAKLRAFNTSSNPVILHVNMDTGHCGKSGRFEHLREIAQEYGFLLDVLSKPETIPRAPRRTER